MEVALAHVLAVAGAVVVHGAAFEVAKSHILVLGPGHAGKSTLSVAALRAGGRVVSDDALLAFLTPVGSCLTPLRKDLLLREGARKLITGGDHGWGLLEGNADAERPVLQRSKYPACFLDELMPDRIWIVSVDRRRSTSFVARLSAAHALAALIRSTSKLFLSARYPKARQEQLAVLSEFANQMCCWRLKVGTHLLESPELALGDLVRRTSEGAVGQEKGTR